ncbi:hypothetical protein B0H14DRAFT_625112 [Mycena olivaceomarginata]|nr:hypothetical protein B0H14DRAFT_625112 [Mycena olivaceomarginata]
MNAAYYTSEIGGGFFNQSCWRLDFGPNEETLAAMLALQKYNITAPVSKRKSFLTEFSATEYEYIIVPLSTELDFFILQPGEAPRRFSSPYTGLPRVTSSAHPFFVPSTRG